jgi:hypothetical protein
MTMVTWYLATTTGPSKTSKLVEAQWKGPLGQQIQTDFGNSVIAKMQAQAKPADMMAPLIARLDAMQADLGPAKGKDLIAELKTVAREELRKGVDTLMPELLASMKGKMNRIIQDEMGALMEGIEEDKKELATVLEVSMKKKQGFGLADLADEAGEGELATILRAGNMAARMMPGLEASLKDIAAAKIDQALGAAPGQGRSDHRDYRPKINYIG